MKFARWVFAGAGVYGLLVLPPLYLLEPPDVTHPEFYYGFTGVAVAWQVLFLLLARDPVRYRLLMIPSVLEKAAFGIPAVVLFQQGRTSGLILGFGIVDLVLGVLFTIAFVVTPKTG
jgi:hypothetical protein